MVGAMGRSEVNVFGADVSFLGFLAILLLRCSPLAMMHPRWSSRIGKSLMVSHKAHEKWGHEAPICADQIICAVSQTFT